jgi:hypothetical protein
MSPKTNIELGSGQIYFKGLDESIDISDPGMFTTEETWADEMEYIPKISDAKEVTIECESVEFNREWTLAYCKICRQPIPITQFDALTLGTTGWTCPLCTVIERMKRRGVVRDCCSSCLI